MVGSQMHITHIKHTHTDTHTHIYIYTHTHTKKDKNTTAIPASNTYQHRSNTWARGHRYESTTGCLLPLPLCLRRWRQQRRREWCRVGQRHTALWRIVN